jgi:hypothetical protein
MRRILQYLVVVLLAAPLGVAAQGVTTASLTGIVKDKTGEVIPGANIVVTHMPSGTTYGAASRVDGYYNIEGMRVGGPYTIKVSFVGYKEQVQDEVYLELGQTLILNYDLISEATELQAIVITGVQDAILNSEKIGASSNFSNRSITRLPSIGRDFRDITRLTPQAGGSAFSFGGRSNLYNNLSIDGATMNNVFGLNPLPGGQSAVTPFSLDAIQEMTVSLSPYDVRQGNFTGAGISAITRSGTNEISGSAYYFFRSQSFAGTEIDGVESPVPDFNYKNYGFRVGGPLIKDKLFYFVNVELEQRSDPFITFPVRATGEPSSSTNTQGTDDRDPATGLLGLREFLINNYNYDPGSYKDFSRATESKRYVMRFDYNINQNHKLTLRGNITNAFQDQFPSGSGGFAGSPPGGRGNSNNVLSFSSAFYRINNDQYSGTLELNSVFGGGKFANNLVIGYTALRDFRQNAGGTEVPGVPTVDILGPNGQNMTSFGPDAFTKNNKLDQDVIQFNDNFTIYLKDHTITVGTANEYYSFNNVFTPVVNGNYRYNSLADFYADADPSSTALQRPANYNIQYVSVAGGASATAAKWEALQLGFFAQDVYKGLKNLTLTAGLRVDVPLYLTDLPANNYANAINFNGEQLRVGGWPEVRPLWSPRIGFNWDVNGDRSTQVRGGTGVLTGRIPFVWLSNAVSNNGLYFGNFSSTNVPFDVTGDGFPYNFSLTPYTASSEQYSDLVNGTPTLVTNPLAANYGRSAIVGELNTVSKNFKFPQVWRTNIAVDQKLPGGIVGTLEFIYTKDINAVLIRNANLRPAVATLAGDGRPLFGASGSSRQIYGNDRRLSGDVAQALVLDNTNEGHQYSITTQFRKNFTRDFTVMAAYTYTDAREVNSQSGSTAGSVYSSQANVLGPNNSGLSYANALTPHRIVAYGSYHFEYMKRFGTTIGLTYEGRSGFNYSYTYNGDPNSDGTFGNDLIYVPRNQSEIVLAPSNANDPRSLDQIWTQLDNYIQQDPYLSQNRGKYVARNGAIAPWVDRLNLSVLQDVYIDVRGKRHTLQFSVNIDNVLNMLNSSWGLIQVPSRTQLLRSLGYETPHTAGSIASPSNGGTPWAATTGRPVYAFDLNADGSALTTTNNFDTSTTSGGRWQLQLGVRYIF